MSLKSRVAAALPPAWREPARRAYRATDLLGRRAIHRARTAAEGLPLPRPPAPAVDGIPIRLLQAKRRDLERHRHFGRRDLDKLAEMLDRADGVVSVAEAYRRREHWPERFVAMRHDMDHDVENAIKFARWEAEHGWKSTYYVLHTDWYWDPSGSGQPSAFVLRALDEIASLGHEIGVHNNAIAAALRYGGDPASLLDRDLAALRRHGFEIVGTAAHGDPLARSVGFANHEIFAECPDPHGRPAGRTLESADPVSGRRSVVTLRPVPMRDFGLEYEAYFIGHTRYLSEAEGRWNQGYDELAAAFLQEGGFLQVLTHPAHWGLGDEVIRPIPAMTAARSDTGGIDPELGDPTAEPFPILVRGDCCSRRAILMNKDIFGGNPQMVRDEKSRSDFFLDHLTVGSPDEDDIGRYMDIDRLTGSHRDYALAQRTRDTLNVEAARLIVLDSYADTNFKAWRHREHGWKLWVYPRYLRDRRQFERDFELVDYLALDEAVEVNIKLIERYRAQVGDVPVLYLQQPTAYYRKLDHRDEFGRLGVEIQKRVPKVFVGDVDESLLEPADLNSSGPGQTLHFSGPTYRRMIDVALEQGLGEWLSKIPATSRG